MRLLICFVALCSAIAASAAGTTVRVHRGELEGAKFAWAQPRVWNRCILLLAHGSRPESAPLVADLFPEHAAYKALLDEGWIVGKSSYRRNGLIIGDAIKDLDNLRAEIVRRTGNPERVLIEGDSLGGLIAVLMAERRPEEKLLYHGVVAIGPALDAREPTADAPGISMLPEVPIVFLCNRTELEAARGYTQMKMPGAQRRLTPALLRVDRDGHINVNQAERLVALRTLNLWLDQGPETLPAPASGTPFVDVTRIPDPVPSRVFLDEDRRGFTAHVAEISAVFGNLLLDAQSADLDDVGLTGKIYFEVTLKEQRYRVFLGKDFNSVKRGEWVMFLNADGFYWLARNGMDAAQLSEAETGDLVHVRRYDDAPAAEP